MTRKVSAPPNVKLVSSRSVYRGPAFSVVSDRVREPGGIVVQRDVVRHSGSVVIMAVEEDGKEQRVLLVRQYRYAAGRDLWELPAGRIDEDEAALPAAKRELLEETGYTAQNWQKALHFYSSPGFVDETMTVFLARGLKRGTAQPEEDEFIRKRLFPLSTLLTMIRKQSIVDAKTVAGALWLNTFSGNKAKRKVR
jgi:ADP-ribose pyrophosphatase